MDSDLIALDSIIVLDDVRLRDRDDHNAIERCRPYLDDVPPVLLVRLTEDTAVEHPSMRALRDLRAMLGPEAPVDVRLLRAVLRPEAAALIPDVDAAVPVGALMADVKERVPEEALVLADSFRTLEAARRAKRTAIRATIQEGTLADAIELAITRNARRARLLSTEAQETAALRLMELHPDWSEPEVARAVGCSQTTAQNARKRREVQGVMAMTGYPLPSRAHELAVARAPRELWRALGRAVQEAQQHQPWSAETTRHVADMLMNETLSEERKQAFLQDTIETGGCPGFTQRGEPTLGTLVQSGRMQQLYKEADAIKEYDRIMSAFRRYQRAHPVAEAAAILNGQHGLRNNRDHVISQTRENIAYLRELLYRPEHPESKGRKGGAQGRRLRRMRTRRKADNDARDVHH